MGHSVGKAAENATAKSLAKAKAERTTEQIISDIRKNVTARLAVTPDDIRVLLEQYDLVVVNIGIADSERGTAISAANALADQVTDLALQVRTLTVANDQFRTVYEQENIRGGITFEAVSEGTDQNALVNTVRDLGVITPAEIAANELHARIEKKQNEAAQGSESVTE